MIHGGVFKVAASGSNDPLILWDDTPLEVTYFDPGGSAYFNLYFYENRPAGYYLAEPNNWTMGTPTFDFANMPPWNSISTGEYLVKWDLVSVVSGDETGPYFVTSAEGVWGDAFRYNISFQDTNSDGTPTHVILDVTLATDDGTGSPVPGSESTKRVTFIGGAGATNYGRDLFSGTAGQNLTARSFSPASGTASGAAWIADSGTIEVDGSSNAQAAAGSGTDNRYVADFGMADTAIYINAEFLSNDTNGAGIVFRRQDASNYWLFVVDTPVTAPTLKLIEVNAGTPTVRASEEITLYGGEIYSNGKGGEMRAQLNGSEIRGQFLSYWVRTSTDDNDKLLTTVTYTSSSMATETHHGIYLGNEDAEIEGIEVFDSEIGYTF